ncbi:MAG: outer membrane lipoprotein carrier protein LolA [Treponema sp.]|nr:outer membrane lipoprotein carrier protein LolA [Treponema sp.]
MKYFYLIIFAFLSGGLQAQSPAEDVFRYPLETKTLDAFKTTCSRLAEHPFTTGNFEQEKTLSRLQRSLKSSGTFIIAADLGMVWDTAKPFPSTLALGKDYLMQSRPGGKKTILSAQGNETFIRMAEVLSAVFSGRSQGLLDNFEIYYSGSPAAWELGLSPKDGAIGSFAEKIIMKGDTAIRYITVHEQGGDTIRYILSGHSYPEELSIHEKALFSLP